MKTKCLPLTAVRQGMILGKAVKDEQGRVLCGVGTKITERLIQRFDTMGILTLFIETDEHLSAAEVQQLKAQVKKRFSNIAPDSPTKMIETYLIKKIESDN